MGRFESVVRVETIFIFCCPSLPVSQFIVLEIMTEFDTNLPGVRQVQKYIKEEQKILIQLTTQETITGKILWQDPQCICGSDESEQSVLIWRQALIYIKPVP